MDKKQIALKTSEELLEEMELKEIDDHSALLKCLRLARLTKDNQAIEWLLCEINGYKIINDGISSHELEIAMKHGRGNIKDEAKRVFTETVSELASLIETSKVAISNITNSGIAVSGELALLSIKKHNEDITRNIYNYTKDIREYERRLAILRGQYYDYALKSNIELKFSDQVASIFDYYRQNVDRELMNLSSDIINKLTTIEDGINVNNPEIFSQALTTCRRLFSDVSNLLFENHFSDFDSKIYKTKSGRELDISGDHYLNRLFAVIELLENKSASKTLIGSNVLYIVDWIENLNSLQCKGVHYEISKKEAMQCIIHTYICLGDILEAQSM